MIEPQRLFSDWLAWRSSLLTRWMLIALVKPTGRATILSVPHQGNRHGQTVECRGHTRPKNPGSRIPRDDGRRKSGRSLGGLQDSPAESTYRRPTS
jgi:hypothetical protein